MVPLAVKEVRETTGANMNKFMEDSWNNGLVMDLKVEASISGQAH
mgnify:CR=1 FL=1